MLAPDERQLLLDGLRPPDGSTLDVSVGTTYTLDLEALVRAPLAFALFDAEQIEQTPGGEDAATPGSIDRVAVLESLRRFAGRTTVFCHRGGISLPSNYQLSTVYSEGMVQQVRPRQSDANFHPKVWVLRFCDGDSVRHRLIIRSRNLTADRSWDTVLTLDEVVSAEARGAGSSSQTAPAAAELGPDVARWLGQLTDLPGADLSGERSAQIADLRRTVAAARFELPEPFTGATFHSLGVGDDSPWPFPSRVDRVAIVSPFLTGQPLRRLAGAARPNTATLVSRPDALAGLQPEVLREFHDLRILAPGADGATSDGEIPTGPGTGRAGAASGFSGLHAKIFILDHGGESEVFVGSANATWAAFHSNAEVLVGLTGPTRTVGTRAFLEGIGTERAFGDLTVPWEPDGALPEPEDPVGHRLDELLAELTAITFRLTAEEHDDRFRLRLAWQTQSQPDLARLAESESESGPGTVAAAPGLRIRAWLISQTQQESVELDLAAGGVELCPVEFERLTPYLALEMSMLNPSGTSESPLGSGNHHPMLTRVAVVGCDVSGFPRDRPNKLFGRLLSEPGQVMRYLLFLLADGRPVAAGSLDFDRSGSRATAGGGLSGPVQVPLFESLVRGLAVDPAMLDRVHRFVEDLRAAGADDLLPKGWDELWGPIWTARTGAGS